MHLTKPGTDKNYDKLTVHARHRDMWKYAKTEGVFPSLTELECVTRKRSNHDNVLLLTYVELVLKRSQAHAWSMTVVTLTTPLT